MVFQPEARQFIDKAELPHLSEETPTIIDAAPIEHARTMPAAVRQKTHAAALDIQPDPNEADLTLGHLQGLIGPLTDLLHARGNRPLNKLTIIRAKTKLGIGDEEYLEKDIKRIGEFMLTDKYKQLTSRVKENISTYLREQEQELQHLEAEAADAERDHTEVIRPAPRPAQDTPQEGRVAKFFKRFGLR